MPGSHRLATSTVYFFLPLGRFPRPRSFRPGSIHASVVPSEPTGVSPTRVPTPSARPCRQPGSRSSNSHSSGSPGDVSLVVLAPDPDHPFLLSFFLQAAGTRGGSRRTSTARSPTPPPCNAVEPRMKCPRRSRPPFSFPARPTASAAACRSFGDEEARFARRRPRQYLSSRAKWLHVGAGNVVNDTGQGNPPGLFIFFTAGPECPPVPWAVEAPPRFPPPEDRPPPAG